MKVGAFTWDFPVTLAPLAGYGDIAFRRLCRDYGAAFTVTEMVSVKGLAYGNEKTETLLRRAPNESPSCVQLFGSDPEFFYKAAGHAALRDFDIIDINMGCPVPKVTKCGEGGALMKDVARAADIVRACIAGGGGRPVTVKHRLGVTDDAMVAPRFAAAMQAAGAAMLTVHGRTVAQGYGGKADWNKIADVARAVTIPVLGNGDITSREDVLRAKDYGVAGVAIGRGALGHPDIFCPHGRAEPLGRIIGKHLDYALLYFPEEVAVRTMRKHICRYLAGVRGTAALRAKVNTITDAATLRKALAEGAGPCLYA